MRTETPFVIAVYRYPFVVTAVMGSGEVLEVLRARALVPMVRADRVAAVAREYAATCVVVERRSALGGLLRLHGFKVFELSLSAVLETLLPVDAPRTLTALYRNIVERHASLRRFVSFSPDGMKLSLTARWKNLTLLPIAMGIAIRFGVAVVDSYRRAPSPTLVPSLPRICDPSSSDARPRPRPPEPIASSASCETTSGTQPMNSSDA